MCIRDRYYAEGCTSSCRYSFCWFRPVYRLSLIHIYLFGTGIVGDPAEKEYSPLEYQNKNGDWIPLKGLTFEEVDPESGEKVTVETETGTEPGVIYSCDVKAVSYTHLNVECIKIILIK